MIFFFHLKNKIKSDKILDVRFKGLFWVGNKVGCFFFLWTLGLAGFTQWLYESRGRGSSWPKVWTLGLGFGGFRLRQVEGSDPYILFDVYFPAHLFGLSTNVWPFNPITNVQD